MLIQIGMENIKLPMRLHEWCIQSSFSVSVVAWLHANSSAACHKSNEKKNVLFQVDSEFIIDKWISNIELVAVQISCANQSNWKIVKIVLLWFAACSTNELLLIVIE